MAKKQKVEQNLDGPKDGYLDNTKITIKCKTKNQKTLVKTINDKEITICSGLAGTGKTFLSCGIALQLIKKYKKYKKIILIKSVTTLKNEEIGFLKGTMKEKMEPFMYSFINNFEKIVGREVITKLRSEGIIEELPIAYLRGINLDNAIIIIDEAQNISKDNIRTIMTRLGHDSKMVFLGDENQVDMKNTNQSALKFIMDKFNDIDEIGIVQLTEEDVVRNPLIKKIEKVFNNLTT